MNLRLPMACIVVLLLIVSALVLRQVLPERVVAEPRPGHVVLIKGRLMKHEEAEEWLSQRNDLSNSNKWIHRRFVLETRIPASLSCEDAYLWFCTIATAGLKEFRIVFEDLGRKEARFFVIGGGTEFDDLPLPTEFTPYRTEDQTAKSEDGTPVRFRWIGIHQSGVMVGGKLWDTDTLLDDLMPRPDDRFIFVCDPNAPFDAVPRLQHLIEESGCRPSVLVLGK